MTDKVENYNGSEKEAVSFDEFPGRERRDENGLLESVSDNSAADKEMEQWSSDGDQMPSFIGLRGQRLNVAVSIICGIGFLLFGYDQGVMGSLLTLNEFRNTFPKIDSVAHPENSTLQGAVVAVYELGCMATALSTLYLGDKLGRRKVTFLGAFIMLIGGALQACAFTTTHLAIARVITGFGNGYITSTVPVWQAEVAKAHSRGKVICLQGSQIALGICISYWVDFGFYFLDHGKHASVSFRFPIAFQCVFPLIMIPFIFNLPESPRWLIKKGFNDKAKYVFAALNGVHLNHPIVEEEYTAIEQSLAMENRRGGDKMDFRILGTQGEKRHFHRLCLAGWLQLMQQISGINLITYYAGTIFESFLHMSSFQSRILAACNGTEYFLASLLAFFTIERYGRRGLLLFGTAGQCLTMVALTITAYYGDPDVAKEHGFERKPGAAVASAVFLFVFNTFFGMGMLSITWLYSPEIASLEIRAPTSAISTACNWISNFVIVMITPIAFTNIKNYTYTIFAVINFLMVPTIYFLYPETAGRSLEEMDVIFNQTPISKPWQVVKIAREMPFSDIAKHEDEKWMAKIEHEENVADERARV
ncbi:Piso0_005250 [Millerozyma farinosa CBS 7064]|uniref:Piso0_005250 protein n=1 Tax=Pichia sorbitophila (strain ATCC MYA-4447 / BCRC 22081 / CBS 7064 / NBRC 10061 / NRRL Y-12695) TaxID=559304 RepID=G8Y4L6_PICSO|nr:Piso0_005250 [Millerozyma farinosa CBS 7064]